MPSTFELDTSGYGDTSAATPDRGTSPGKRMLTDRLQRKAAGTSPPDTAAPGEVQRREHNGLSCDQSFLDSILDGPVQRHAENDEAGPDVHALAAHGTAGSGGAMPYLARIQTSFGAHDVSHVQAHTDGAASDAARGMGAHAFATGDHVAFAGTPDLHTAAHEAAHIVQQRAGVHLKGGVGEVGDVYEQHADAVADAVVRGESAEGLLDQMAPVGGEGHGVQMRAVQLDDDIELAQPGAPARQPRILREPEAPKPRVPGRIEAGATGTYKMGAAAMPHIKAAFDAIQTIKGIWDLLKPGGGRGETKQLPESISGYNRIELDRVIRYAVAEAYIKEAFAIGDRHGVQFKDWVNGVPPKAAAPAAPAASAQPAPVASAAAPDTSAATEETPPAAAPFVNALQGLAIDDLKDRALQELKSKVAANTVRMEPVSWWWNGANERGFGEPINLRGMGGDRETWGKITFRIAGAKIPDATPAGIPFEARHFGVTPNVKFVNNLGWFSAGRVDTETREDSMDDLELRITETSFNESANAPVGAHHIAAVFVWDDSSTDLDLDVTFIPASWMPKLQNINTDKEPET